MKRSHRLLWIGALSVLLLLLPIPVVSNLEEHDGFCASCHTAPEVTYVARARTVQDGENTPEDLSSAHYQVSDQAFRCIDCHRGNSSLQHRFQALTLGAKDTVIWITGQADQTIEKRTADAPDLLEASCLKCHLESLVELGFNNHYHNQLPQALLADEMDMQPTEPEGGLSGELFVSLGESKTTVRCLDCHLAHHSIPDGNLTLFMDVDNILLPACEKCHIETGEGPPDLTGSGE